MRTTFMKKVTLIGISFTLMAFQSSSLSFSGRDYADVFEGASLTREQIDKVKTFDRWAFKDEQNIFVSAKKINVTVKYVGTVDRNFWDIKHNANYLERKVFPKMLSTVEPQMPSDITVIGLGNLEAVNLAGFRKDFAEFLGPLSDAGQRRNVHEFSDGKCVIIRNIEDDQVVSSLILVELRNGASPLPSQSMSIISCINRGHYFHFGMSNAVAFENSQFVRLDPIEAQFLPQSPTLELPENWHVIFSLKNPSRLNVLKLVTNIVKNSNLP